MSSKQEFIDAFMEGTNLGVPNTVATQESIKFRTLVGLLFDSRLHVKQLTSRIEQIDSDMAHANIQVKCRSCDEYYSLDYDVSEFSRDMSYCGGSPRCCP